MMQRDRRHPRRMRAEQRLQREKSRSACQISVRKRPAARRRRPRTATNPKKKTKDCKREVSTTHDHNCSQPTLRELPRPQSLQIAKLASTSVFVLQPSTSGRRPSASGLRPWLPGLRPPAFKQSDTVGKSTWHDPVETSKAQARNEKLQERQVRRRVKSERTRSKTDRTSKDRELRSTQPSGHPKRKDTKGPGPKG